MIAPHDATPIAEAFSWCTECPAAHVDADDENTHHESTGHTATRRQDDAFVERQTAGARGFAFGTLQASIAEGMRDALDARARGAKR